jgi:hypothetical protein
LEPAQDWKGLGYGSEVDRALAAFANSAMRVREVDAYITELVRLRCAQVHDCRRCASQRLVDAMDDVDERVVDEIADYENSDLSLRAKAALRLTDAMILAPAQAGPELRAELHAHFSDEQIAEICLDVVKWSQQKTFVALRLDAPTWEGKAGVTFDANGQPRSLGPLAVHDRT